MAVRKTYARRKNVQKRVAVNPKLILTGSGLEICFGGSQEDLNTLRQATAKLEESLAQALSQLETLRAAVQKNEEIMDTLVDCLHLTDDFSIGEPELLFEPESLVS